MVEVLWPLLVLCEGETRGGRSVARDVLQERAAIRIDGAGCCWVRKSAGIHRGFALQTSLEEPSLLLE